MAADVTALNRTLEQELEAKRQERGAVAYDQQTLRAMILRLETELIVLLAEHQRGG